MKNSEKSPLTDKISNHHQIGGIETSVLDNGSGRGTRIAWVNTGTGLRFKVVPDRALDIADAFYNQYSLAWLSHGGITPPDSYANKGLEWLRSFGGGLMTTCGLSHIGGPESDSYGERNLHGRISNLRSEVLEIIQPNLMSGGLEMRITGITRETSVFGPSLELKRTISCTLGKPWIKIHDEVRNCGNQPAPHMILYHINFGWPLVDDGTEILGEGEWKSRGNPLDNLIFRKGNDFKKCLPPIDDHLGGGEACAFIDPLADEKGICTCGLNNKKLNLKFTFRFRKDQLPYLTNWQHWGKGEYVTALEPGTNPPIGQKSAREQGKLIHLQPGEVRNYDIEMEVSMAWLLER